MTNVESIYNLKLLKKFINYDEKNPIVKEATTALNMAIEALLFQQKFVTCKDCKHWDLSESYGFARMCEHWQDTMREYGYCSYGKRRDEE